MPSTDPSIPLRWFVASVGDSLKVNAIVGYDESGTEVVRVDQPLGPPYPDYRVLESAPKRDLATGVVDGAPWALTGADTPLSDGTGPVTCVTLTFASESASTCPVRVAGGVNGNGIIDATVAVLRRRTFVLAHLERSAAEFCVTLDDGNAIIVPVVVTGSTVGLDHGGGSRARRSHRGRAARDRRRRQRHGSDQCRAGRGVGAPDAARDLGASREGLSRRSITCGNERSARSLRR